jgi:Spy/CpxP family protein refolding chaperone
VQTTARLLFLATLISTVAFPLVVRAGDDQPTKQEKPGPGGERPGRGRFRHGLVERLSAQLGLDPAKQAEIQKIASAARADGRPLVENMRSLRDQLRGKLAEDAPDQKAVMQLADKLGAAETEVHKHRLRTLLRIRELLTPEQRRELVRLLDERREHRDWRGPGRTADDEPPSP